MNSLNHLYIKSCVILLFITLCVWGREGSNSFTLQGDSFEAFDKFGFYNGGQASLSASKEYSSTPITMYACTEPAVRMLYSSFHSVNGFCKTKSNVTDCFLDDVYDTGEINFGVSTKSRGDTMYYFGFITCEPETYEVAVNYTFLNPDGQQLSSEFVPLPTIYLLFSVIWFSALITWVANWIVHRRQKNKLHKMITLFPFAKLFWEIGSFTFWDLASKYAVIEHYSIPAYGLLRLFCELLLVLVFFLISKGWGILNQPLGYDKYVIITILLFFGGSKVIAIWIGFFQIFVFAGYSLIALFIFVFVKKSLICLDGLRNDPDINVAGDHLHGTDLFIKKRRMLTRFKIDMIFFCVAQIIITGLESLVFYDAIWVTATLFELCDVIMFLLIMVSFRLRSENVYYKLEGAGGVTEKTRLMKAEEMINWAEIEKTEEAGNTNPNNFILRPGLAAEGRPQIP